MHLLVLNNLQFHYPLHNSKSICISKMVFQEQQKNRTQFSGAVSMAGVLFNIYVFVGVYSNGRFY